MAAGPQEPLLHVFLSRTLVLTWRDLPFPSPLVIEFFAKVDNKIMLTAACCSSVTGRGHPLGASCLWFLSSCKSMVRSPSSAADERTSEASLISSILVSRSFVIVLRYCGSEQSKPQLRVPSGYQIIISDGSQQVIFLLRQHLTQTRVPSAGHCLRCQDGHFTEHLSSVHSDPGSINLCCTDREQMEIWGNNLKCLRPKQSRHASLLITFKIQNNSNKRASQKF